MASNFVKVDASHYERLVRNSVMLDQIKRVFLNRIAYSKFMDGITFYSAGMYEDLTKILDNGTLHDFEIRYNYLRDKEKSENDELERECEA